MLSSLSVRLWTDREECGFHLVSRFRDTASLYYVYTGPRSHKPGRPKTLDGKINYKKLDLTRMVELHIEGLEGTAYTLIAYSKALKQKVRLVIWIMPNGKHKLFFSTKTSLSPLILFHALSCCSPNPITNALFVCAETNKESNRRMYVMILVLILYS